MLAARLQRAGALAERDGHVLAGFIDAEGSFAISPANGRRNWVCEFELTQRADDRALLERFRDVTRIGNVTSVPARGNSKPQARWCVRSQLGCMRLVESLERFELRGRKRHEFTIWADAVRVWNGASGPSRSISMREAAASLIGCRRYVDTLSPAYVGPASLDPALHWYLGGFFSGEGYFILSSRCARGDQVAAGR
jgi:hypothetical protein